MLKQTTSSWENRTLKNTLHDFGRDFPEGRLWLLPNTSYFQILLFPSHNNILWLNLLGFVQQGCLKNSLDFSLLPNSLTNHIQDIKMSSNLIAVNAVNSSSVNEQDKRLVNSALYNLTLLPKLFACIYKQNIWQTQLQ